MFKFLFLEGIRNGVRLSFMVVSPYAWFWEQPCVTLNTYVNKIKFRIGPLAFIIMSLKIWFMMLDFKCLLSYLLLFHIEEMLKISGKAKITTSDFSRQGWELNVYCLHCQARFEFFVEKGSIWSLNMHAVMLGQVIRVQVQFHFLFPYQISYVAFHSTLFNLGTLWNF